MFEAQYYKIIYFLIVGILTFFVSFNYLGYNVNRVQKSRRRPQFGTVLLTIVMIVLIGFRPISGRYFIDMRGYASSYASNFYAPFEFTWQTTNKIFDNLFLFMASKGIPVETFFFMMAFLYFGAMYMACRRLFPRDTMIAMLVCLAAFSTYPYAVNGIKAGVAASIFLMAIAYREKIILSVVLALISWGFHHSMQVVVVAYVLVLFVRNPKYYFLFWIVSLVLSALHVTFFQTLFANYTDDQGAGYLVFESNEHWAEVIRFRPDFILYSALPVAIGYYTVIVRHVKSSIYLFILELYLMTNGVWMLCMYATFTNRIAYLSWFMYPIVLLYPFTGTVWDKRQYRYMTYVVLGHLLISIFLLFIYS